MLERVLEPEVMDTPEEAVDYDSMDHGTVNRVFVDDFLAAEPAARSATLRVIDIGTGTAQIPIELCRRDVVCQVEGAFSRFAQRFIMAREPVAQARHLVAQAREVAVCVSGGAQCETEQTPGDDRSWCYVAQRTPGRDRDPDAEFARCRTVDGLRPHLAPRAPA